MPPNVRFLFLELELRRSEIGQELALIQQITDNISVTIELLRYMAWQSQLVNIRCSLLSNTIASLSNILYSNIILFNPTNTFDNAKLDDQTSQIINIYIWFEYDEFLMIEYRTFRTIDYLKVR